MTNNFVITSPDEILRIDKLLSEKFKSNSRTYFQYLLDNGCVLVNKKRVKKRVIPKIGDEIEVFFQALEDTSLIPQKICQVVYTK